MVSLAERLAFVLPTLRLTAQRFVIVQASSPWSVEIPPERTIRVLALLSGAARFETEAAEERRRQRDLSAGDLIVLPHAVKCTLGDGSTVAPVPLPSLSGEDDDGLTSRVSVGGSGPGATLLVGTFSYDNDLSHTLLSALPAAVFVPSDYPNLQVWLQAISLEVKSRRVGTNTVMARLLEVLLLYVVRGYVERGEAQSGWLAALGDPQIGRALTAVHRDPAKGWDVVQLASLSAMSRAAFYRRFCELIGEPPLAYLRRWRMHCASEALRDPNRSVMEIARAVGYDSEASFARAFKRHFGRTPSTFRASVSAETNA